MPPKLRGLAAANARRAARQDDTYAEADELASSIGKNVRRLRDARTLTQAELASAAGTGLHSVNDIEKGKRLPTLVTVRRIALALGATVDDLCTNPTGTPPAA